jgi:hypothetical protein
MMRAFLLSDAAVGLGFTALVVFVVLATIEHYG